MTDTVLRLISHVKLRTPHHGTQMTILGNVIIQKVNNDMLHSPISIIQSYFDAEAPPLVVNLKNK